MTVFKHQLCEILLGYDGIEQCKRYLRRKHGATVESGAAMGAPA